MFAPMLLCGTAVCVVVACSSSPSTTQLSDLGGVKNDFASTSAVDSSIPVDFSNVPSCASIEAYCAASSTACPQSWATAQNAATWCTSGLTANIYITKNGPCGGGYYAVSIVSDSLTPTGRQYAYVANTGGALVSVGSYDPNDDTGTYTCVAGPTDAAQAIGSSGCQYDTSMCVNGVLQ